MCIVSVIIHIHAPWVSSLKDKRREVKSLLCKLRNKFNVSAAEVAEQDTHQTIVLGIAAVAAHPSQGDSILDHVIDFVEGNTEGEMTQVIRQIH